MKVLLLFTGPVVATLLGFHAQAASSEAAKPNPPAKIREIAKEETLASIVLTAEAEQRLGITTTPAAIKKTARFRTFAGELLVALGEASTADKPQTNSSNNRVNSIYSLLPGLTPAEIIRVAHSQVEADGQVASAQVQLDAANVALKRAEGMLAERAGSIRTVDEAKAQAALAQVALQTARNRRALLGAPLFEAVKREALWLRVPVYVGHAPNLKTSEPVRVGSLGGWTNQFTRVATPVRIPLSFGTGSMTIDLYYELQNQDNSLRPGQRVAVQIGLQGQEENLVVPSSALLYDIRGGTWIYENTATHGFTRRRVEVRYVTDNEAVLAHGPKPDAKVVTTGAAELFGAEFGFGK